ncbi:MAG: hypothetical protein ACTSUR_04840 [Candidatus Heimdallarchaeaceae archaeon]
MLICFFKLEDIGPTLVDMVLDQNFETTEDVIDKFQFSGSFTYSLIFQGMVTIEDFSSALYGPFPFAFSTGFVQYAFPFIVEDKTMKDKRMKNKSFGLLLMLVPEMVSKIDTFREELEKLLIYRFRNINKVEEVNKEFLSDILKYYNKIVTYLLSSKQANLLSKQLFEFLDTARYAKKKTQFANISIIYPRSFREKMKKIYESFLSSLPYLETSYLKSRAVIKTKKYVFHFCEELEVDEKKIDTQDALIFIVDVANKKYKEVYTILSKRKNKSKIALVVSLPEDLEKASTLYAKFFTKLQLYVSDQPFFSANFTSIFELKAKMLEAIFWTLSPIT